MKAWIKLFKAICQLMLYLFGAICVVVIPIGVFLVALYSALILIINYVPGVVIGGTILFLIMLATIWANGKE